MSSLYSMFAKETMGWDTYEDDNSFVTYEIQEIGPVKCLKVIEMFTKIEARGQDKWRDLMAVIEEIAINNKCSTLSAQISKSTSDFTQQRTEHLCRLYGMELSYDDVFTKIFRKGVKYE